MYTNQNNKIMRKDKRSYNGFTNKRMNKAVYAERREIMKHIYNAKTLLRSVSINMPRIDIRIVEADKTKVTALGLARMRDNIIWIPSDALKYKKHIYQIVLHELLHAIWGIDHDLNCKLMHTNLQTDLTKKEAERIFLKYAKKCNKLAEVCI